MFVYHRGPRAGGWLVALNQHEGNPVDELLACWECKLSVEPISWFKATAVWKMAAKPVKKIAEELKENIEKLFGEDATI